MAARVATRGTTTGLWLAVVSAATFSTSGSFAASLLDAGWTPGAAVTARVGLAALLLTVPALLALRRSSASLRRGLPGVTLYGLVAVAGCQLAYFNAVQRVSVAVALLLEYSGVLLVVLWLWLRHGQRPRWLTVAGAAVAVAGLVLVLDLVRDHDVDPVGVLWGLVAAVGLAVYFVISARTHDALPPLVVAWGGLSVGAVVLAGAGLVGVLPLAAPRTDVTLLDTQLSWVLPVAGLALVSSAIAYVTGITGVRLLGAKVASFVSLAEVLFAVAFAWALLGQSLRALQLVGGALILGGIALVRLDEVAGTPQPAPDRPLPEEPASAAVQERHPAASTAGRNAGADR